MQRHLVDDTRLGTESTMPHKTQRARTAYQREYRARRRKAAPVLAFPGAVPDPAAAVHREWARRDCGGSPWFVLARAGQFPSRFPPTLQCMTDSGTRWPMIAGSWTTNLPWRGFKTS